MMGQDFLKNGSPKLEIIWQHCHSLLTLAISVARQAVHTSSLACPQADSGRYLRISPRMEFEGD